MRNIKVIRFICLAVLVLSTFSCAKDELIEDFCVDKALAIEYKIEVDLINEQDAQLGSEGDIVVWRWTYYSPVCACNGKTYSNEHYAKLEGIISYTMGDCEN